MQLIRNENFATGTRWFILELTDVDMEKGYGGMTPEDRVTFNELGRDEGTIEEKLMALQILVRYIESD